MTHGRAGLATCSASSRPGQDVSLGNERLDIAQVSSRLQAQAHTSPETVEHVRPHRNGVLSVGDCTHHRGLSPKQANGLGDSEAKLLGRP
jgi:hypothetical protein